MPIFYSQHLKNDRKAMADCEVAHQIGKHSPSSPNKMSDKLSSSMKGSRRSRQKRSQEQPISPPATPPSSPRMVWHSNKGFGLKTKLMSAFQYKDPSKKKTVHFAAIEVQPYSWDYSCDEDVFLKKEEIMAMNKDRFKDAKKIRKERNISSSSDIDISKRASEIERLMLEAFDSKLDKDDQVSICGIEHFVYPAMQQEMIRRKKYAKQQVFDFQKGRRPDPHGLRLARLSEEYTQWARDVAAFKGRSYCVQQRNSFSFAQRRRASV